MNKRTATGGAAIVNALIANGVDTVFGLPGAQMYPFFDALQLNADRVRTLGARHEQTCAYMAFGYARSTGKPGVCAVVPGPGVLNTTAALCTAMGCCAPVLCVTGQVPTAFLGRGRGHLHELSDQLGTLAKLVKWTARIERPEDAGEVINEAFCKMLSGRPGPVVVEMAWDTMAASAPVFDGSAADVPPPAKPDAEEVEQAAQLIANAKRPMIMVGSGAQHAAGEIRNLAEQLGAPVAAFRGGRGIVAEDDELGASSYSAYRLWGETDILIGVGTRLEMPYMRWTGMMQLIDRPAHPPHLVRIDIDPTEMHRLVPHAAIVADAALGAAALADAVAKLRNTTLPTNDDHISRIAQAKAEARQLIEKVQPQLAYLDVIRETLPRDGIVTIELSQMGFASYFGYPVYEPRTYISEGYQGTLGFGFPTALGVKVAQPDKPVVCITGDGGFMFAAQELATAAQEKIGLVVLVFNNSSYGNVRRDQEKRFGNRIIGAELFNPDFLEFTRSFGLESHRVSTPEELRPLLAHAIGMNETVLIEIDTPIGAETDPWEFIIPS